MQHERNKGLFDITQQQLIDLFKPTANPEGLTKAILIFVSLVFSPISLLGCLIFYKKGYRRFMNGEYPRLYNLPPIVKIGMILGAILVWVALYFISKLVVYLFYLMMGDEMGQEPFYAYAFLGLNIIVTVYLFFWFSKWRGGIIRFLSESKRHGSASFATEAELSKYRKPKGFYIGNGLYYNKPGHLISTAGSRSGKGTNLILQNLLMPELAPKMSWVVIDPKGELAAISANVQRKAGRKVIILNPWRLLLMEGTAYNPLDLLKNDWLNLADDVQMLAEAIVPSEPGKESDHWTEKARTYISGLLLHLVTKAPVEERHLGTLWSWLRMEHDNWVSLLADMTLNDDTNAGEIVRACANEIISLMKTSEKEYGSVISAAQKHTDWIKSPALREAMKSSNQFTSSDLASGNTTVYVCIPFDRLKSHNAWLRLVIVSLMRSVIRNPQHDCTFLLDEAYSFGFHSEIDMAFGAYAGFGVHVWSIFQTLGQVKKIYGDNFENLIGNCQVRHFFNISDNFSAEYISKMFGKMSVPEYDDKGELKGASQRDLVTMDELRRNSGDTIYAVIDQLPPAQIPKLPYYEMDLPCDPNPYYKG